MKMELDGRGLTKEERQAITMYVDHNKRIFNHPLIQGFYKDEAHVILLAKKLLSPNSEASVALEGAFRRFLFRIRFTKYLCSLIRYSDIDYHRKRTRHEERQPLVFDTPLGEGESTLGECLYTRSASMEDEMLITDPSSFQQVLHNESLYVAFNRLTDKQKLIITLAYSACVLDRDIMQLLHISQQAISKSRTTALRKMKAYMTESPNGSYRKQRGGVS
ncbi:hypothetical protein [Paenibacillus sp. YYML68]|uniref:hypothetical protein n=1 Tax=Paenibacillus sp. YYML68 TaxID=2909250 RepID=UPI00248FC30D|nr:hypothetical protein [Paenibacillus sp. YYML68]